MKHVYFETLNEYLYIRQDSPESIEHLNTGELYAKNIKNYLFEVTPKLKTSFSTTHFITNSQTHIDNLRTQSTVIRDFDFDDFINFVNHRLRFYLTELQNKPDALLGRLLLKTEVNVSPRDIEQEGSKKLSKELSGIALYQYETIPKGEFGIAASAKVTVYKADYSNGVIKQKEKIDLKINPLLSNKNQSILRVKS